MNNKKSSGFALISILVILILISLGTVSVISTLMTRTNFDAQTINEYESQYLAEAGIQWAMWQCRTTPATCGATQNTIINGKTVTITKQAVAGVDGLRRFVASVEY